jgi:hypothetical protein
MWTAPKNDKTVFKAIEKMNRGDHRGAAAEFQRAGNQYRSPKEKEQLWAAAERSRRIAESD